MAENCVENDSMQSSIISAAQPRENCNNTVDSIEI